MSCNIVLKVSPISTNGVVSVATVWIIIRDTISKVTLSGDRLYNLTVTCYRKTPGIGARCVAWASALLGICSLAS